MGNLYQGILYSQRLLGISGEISHLMP